MAEKSFTLYKRTTGANLVSKPNENLAPTNTVNGGADGGLFFAPPQSLSFSYHRRTRQQQQPPLLPLPSMTHNKSLHNSPPSRRTQTLSSSSDRKNNRTSRDQTLKPKISKSRPFITSKVLEVEDRSNKNQYLKSTVRPLGPDPDDLLKVLGSSYLATATEKFSGSVFTLSPPPSSLPLPKFISCNVEAAAEVDVGATDDLRRLLRLR